MEKKRCRSSSSRGDDDDDDDEDLLLGKVYLIQEILVRLPIVSLLRFKSVCKSWYSLIQTSSFIHLHTTTFFNNSSSSNKFGSFILLPSVDDCSPERSGVFRESALVMLSSSSSVDDESQSVVVSYGRSSGVWRLITSTGYNINDNDDPWSICDQLHDYYDDQVFKVVMNNNKQLVFKLDSLGFPSCYKSYLTFTKDLGIIGSCNGLVCLYDRNYDEVSLCNPATKQFRLLPKPITPSEDDIGPLPTVAAFGFDVETKDYKVVLLTPAFRAKFYRTGAPIECLCRVEVYSLRTNSWRLLEQEQGGITSLPGYLFSDLEEMISLNGSCFFLEKFFHTKHEPYFPENDRFIISFDFTKEIFTPIQLPEHHRDQELYLSCLGDKIALFTVWYEPSLNASYPDEDYSDEEICGYEDYNIWVLNEHSNSSSVNKASWTILKSFRIEHEAPGQWYLPMGISNDGEFAILQNVGEKALFKQMKLYNLATKEFKKDFLTCDIVSSKANAYKPSLVSIIGGNGAGVMSAKEANKKVTLKSSDGENFVVDEVVAAESQTIKHMIKDDSADNEIPLPNVTSKILAKVIEYCKKHVKGPKGHDRISDEDLQSWDAEFVKVDHDTFFDLILAADYLNIKSLLDLTRQTLTDMIKGKTPSHRRKKRRS